MTKITVLSYFLLLPLFAVSQETLSKTDEFLIKRFTELFFLNHDELSVFRTELHHIQPICEKYFVLEIPRRMTSVNCKEEHFYSECVLMLCGESLFFHNPDTYFSLVRFERITQNRCRLHVDLKKEVETFDEFLELQVIKKFIIEGKEENNTVSIISVDEL